jgi:hypothetical protein
MNTPDIQGGWEGRYQRPYAVPERLDLLREPSSGTVRLPWADVTAALPLTAERLGALQHEVQAEIGQFRAADRLGRDEVHGRAVR